MRRTWPTCPLTVLTPVRPGEEGALVDSLSRLPQGGDSPFAQVAETHFARWVVLSGAPRRVPGVPRRSRPLRMQYLLFTSTANRRPEDHVEDLRTGLRSHADAVWGHCVGYPGHDRAAEFRRYLLHNRLPDHRWSPAYDATVREVREGLDLRRRHADLASRTQKAGDTELREAFLAEFGDEGS